MSTKPSAVPPAQILTALADQTVTIPATQQYGRVIRGLAGQLLTVLDQPDTLGGELPRVYLGLVRRLLPLKSGRADTSGRRSTEGTAHSSSR